MKNDDLLAKDLVKHTPMSLQRVTTVHPMCYLAKRTPEQQREIFRAAIEEQAKKEITPPPTSHAPAIHDDRLFTGWDPALRMYTRGRTHRREAMRSKNLVCVFD